MDVHSRRIEFTMRMIVTLIKDYGLGAAIFMLEPGQGKGRCLIAIPPMQEKDKII